MLRIWRFQRERTLRLWRRKRPFVRLDEAIRQDVAASGDDAVAMTRSLVDYLWQAQRHYLHRNGTLAYYPGWPSIYGATNDAVEGVTRLMPLWAAYAGSALADVAMSRDMVAALRTALLHGTDPAHPGYWGDIDERSTLICEAADVALALWLGRDDWWPRLDEAQRVQVLLWLGQAVGRRTADNNWHLFVVLIDAVLAKLNPAHSFSSTDRLERVRSFMRGQGCFTDGPTGQIDFYNAWGFHYALHWLGDLGVLSANDPLLLALPELCRWYQWLFTEQGVPLFGRSLCYRFAASVPLLACAARAPEVVEPGVALGAYLANWRFFAGEGGLRAGRPTQGVFGEDVRWLDPYSGPASSLWGTRSLVMYLALSRTRIWVGTTPLSLPANQHPVRIAVPALDAVVVTDPAQGLATVAFQAAGFAPLRIAAASPGLRDHLRQALTGVASRPVNNPRGAGLRQFSSSLEAYRF
jgi:hypothetical protein